MRTPSRAFRAFLETPWAILPEAFEEIREWLIDREMSGEPERAPIEISDVEPAHYAAEVDGALEIRGETGRDALPSSGQVVVIPLVGAISQRASFMDGFGGGTSVQRFTQQFRRATNDPSVSAVLIDVNSPGGGVFGVPELAAEIFAARDMGKRIVAVSNCMMASAAFWIGSAADEVVVAPSGEVGSIGVFAAHTDISKMLEDFGVKITLISAGKFKTEGNPFEPLSDEARAFIQEGVDEFFGMFTRAVAKHRGTSAAAVRGGMGQGRMLGAKDALRENMVDKIETFDATLARLARGARGRGGATPRAEDERIVSTSTPTEIEGGDLEASAPDGDDQDRRRRRARSLQHG